MGQSAAETVREIEDVRGRLDSELRELEDRLPKVAVWSKRAVGMAVGGGVGGSLFWFAAKRLRSKSKEKKLEATVTAAPAIHLLPDDATEAIAEALKDGRWKTYAAWVGGAWVFFRLLELRQMRRTNKALLERAS